MFFLQLFLWGAAFESGVFLKETFLKSGGCFFFFDGKRQRGRDNGLVLGATSC